MRFLPVKNFAVSLGRQRLEFRRSIAPQEPEQECDTWIFDASEGFQSDFLRAATLAILSRKVSGCVSLIASLILLCGVRDVCNVIAYRFQSGLWIGLLRQRRSPCATKPEFLAVAPRPPFA